MKKNMALALVAVIALGLSACKKDETTTASETTESVTSADGTTTETTTTTETVVDPQAGTVTEETTTETTVDPAGVMNKETIEESAEETVTPMEGAQ